MANRPLRLTTLDVGILCQQAFQGFPQGLDLLIVRGLQKIQSDTIFAGYTVSEYLHTWQVQASLFITLGGNRKRLGRIGDGIHALAQSLAPLRHGGFVFQRGFIE